MGISEGCCINQVWSGVPGAKSFLASNKKNPLAAPIRNVMETTTEVLGWLTPPTDEQVADWSAREAARNFVAESNRIEGIHRPPTDAEIAEHRRFIALKQVTLEDLIAFVAVYQPDAVLRDQEGLDVRVGGYRPPKGSPQIAYDVTVILVDAYTWSSPYRTHVEYEKLHPFTDGNGRSGRALWAWQMARKQGCPLGFLHHFYYQTLEQSGR